MANKKLLFINTKSCIWGGVERYINSMSSELSKNGFENYALFEEKPEYEDKLILSFKKVFFYKKNKIEEIISFFKEKEINTVIINKISNPDLLKILQSEFKTLLIVHDHDNYCLRKHKYFPLTRKNCSLAYNFFYCALCSGMVEKIKGKVSLINIFKKRTLFNMLKKSDISIVLSDFMKNNLVTNGYNKNKIKKIYPFIDVTSDSKNVSGNKPPEILFVGQIIRGKGLDLLINALSYVKEEFKLNIIGKGNDTNFIKTIIKENDLEGKISFYDWTDQPETFYEKADIIVIPSRWQEPFGLVGIEAFSYNKPVIGFDVGGISEWLKNEQNGYLIEPFDHIKMADKIEDLLLNSDKRETYGNSGYKMVKEEYSKENIIKAFTGLFEEA